jgi:hypothetical protein
MPHKLQLISQPHNLMQKQALIKAIGTLAARKGFLGGLAAPIPKLVGGVQKAYGRGQQGVAALRQGLGSSTDDLLKNPLFQRGAQNVSAGKALREQAGLRAGLQAPNTLSHRVGRGLGAAAIGLPLINLPFGAAEYAGAATTDPELVKEYAKNMAYNRVEERLGQFANMPFLDRAKSIFNPQGFTQQFQMPEAENLYEAMSNNDLNNPGIMKYLASFNPFIGSPNDVIRQKVRSEMMQSMQPKEANDKQAMAPILSKAMPILRGINTAFRRGKMTTKYNHNFAPTQKGPLWRTGLNRIAYEAGKKPGTAALGVAGTALTPLGLYGSYQDGKQQVYNAAANDAMGLADLHLRETFNQPGFMGGLGRAGMAVAPGMISDMLLNQVRQSMFPAVNQMQ